MAATIRLDRTPDDPGADMDLTAQLLRAVAAGDQGDVVRIFRPGPTVAFGRLDALRPGFAAAQDIARARGYTPLTRHAGGHAVVYDDSSVIVEVIHREHRSAIGPLENRFVELTDVIRQGLTGIGVETEVGELPDEYCPGRFSLHLDGGPKVVGVAQRNSRTASLTTAVITVRSHPRFLALIRDVYAALDLVLDPHTVGALGDRYPEVEPDAVVGAIALAVDS